MVLITLVEIGKLAIISLVIGFIFQGFYSPRVKTVYDRLHKKKFNFYDFKFSTLVVAPAIVLHELAHKFVAMGYGFTATFELFPFGLILGTFLKLIGSPFLIIAPGFVKISELALENPMAYRLIAFAGPAINLILWLGALFLLRSKKRWTRTQFAALSLTKTLNMWLFFFNMIPFGPLDGAKVFFGPG